MKKSIVFLFVGMAALLSACGSSTTSENTENAVETEVESESETETETESETSEEDIYDEAEELQADGNYADAFAIFKELGDYKDAVANKQKCAVEIVKEYVTENSTGVAMTGEALGNGKLIYNTAISEDVQDDEKAFIAVNTNEQITIGDYYESTDDTSFYLGMASIIVLNPDEKTAWIGLEDVTVIGLGDGGFTYVTGDYTADYSDLTIDSEIPDDLEITEATQTMDQDEYETTTVSFGDSDSKSALSERYHNSLSYAEELLKPTGVELSDLGLGLE